MKIVFIGGRDIHNLGGIENYMYNLATQIVRMGHEPIVFCESDCNREEVVNGFRVIYHKGFKSNLLCKPWCGLKATLRTVLRIKGVDAIHYNAWPPAMSSPIARLFGIPSLMQGHGHGWQRTKYSGFQQKLMKMMEYVAVKITPHLIMCSEAQTQYFKEHHGLYAVTIPTAINLPEVSAKNDSEILGRFGLEKGKYFLYLARLVQDKNPDYLIRAFNEAKCVGYKLVIAGNNPAAPDYVEMLHSLGKDNPNVVFTDAVFGKDKEQLLRNAFSFCIPSTIEGLSISLLEAMSYRLPVVASDIPANREVLDDDKAFWCKAEDVDTLRNALEQAVSAAGNMSEMTEYNFCKVRDSYTWEKVAEKYVEYLKTIKTS